MSQKQKPHPCSWLVSLAALLGLLACEVTAATSKQWHHGAELHFKLKKASSTQKRGPVIGTGVVGTTRFTSTKVEIMNFKVACLETKHVTSNPVTHSVLPLQLLPVACLCCWLVRLSPAAPRPQPSFDGFRRFQMPIA